MPQLYRVRFTPHRTEGVIVCSRTDSSNKIMDPIVYRESDPRPYLPALTVGARGQWQAALDEMGWGN